MGPVPDVRDRNPTYHSTDAGYVLPNDTVEQARLDDQNQSLNELMHNNIIHAPLNNPISIVDVGCGTGNNACDFGALYPNARVYGVDLTTVPARVKPSNVEFVQGDIRQLINHDPRFQPGSVDYVFHRLLVLGMTDWQSYVQKMVTLLRPNGWCEMHDMDFVWYQDGKLDSDKWGWVPPYFKEAERKGLDVLCGSHMKGYLERAGLVDVQVREYRIPFGTWAAEERPETRRIGAHAAREYGMVQHHAIPKVLEGLGYGENEIKEFQDECKSNLAAKVGRDMIFYVTVGRNP